MNKGGFAQPSVFCLHIYRRTVIAFLKPYLFRLIDERQRPDVKIAASALGAGLTLDGGADTTETYVALAATGTTSSLKLKNEDGGEKIVKP